MSDIAAEFDARFKGQTGFDSPARGTVAQGGVDDSRIVEFPKEWLRDNYSRGSQERELASSMFLYCVQLLWEDSQSVKDKRQQQRAKIRNQSERASELIAQADAWAVSAKAILAEFRKSKTIDEALQTKIFSHMTCPLKQPRRPGWSFGIILAFLRVKSRSYPYGMTVEIWKDRERTVECTLQG